jgi:radical SAM superfamily enzyme YgiQ (UPF0313 family)
VSGERADIVLVSLNRERLPSPVIPIGLACVGTALLRAGHRVRVVDLAMCGETYGHREAARLVSGLSPDLVGLSMRNLDNVSWPDSIGYLPEIRGFIESLQEQTAARLFIGGSGFTVCPEPSLDYLGLDLGLSGEGEISTVRLVEEVLLGGGSAAAIPGAVYRGPGGMIRRVPAEIAAAPPGGEEDGRPGYVSLAARDLFDIRRYLEAGASFNIQTKRGCPLHCTYCVYPLLEGRQFRLRSPASVVDEMEQAMGRWGAERFTFVDNIFNLPLQHAKDVCREMVKRKLDIKWETYLHPLAVDEELLGLMIDSGVLGLEFTPDSGSAAMLESYGKDIAVEHLAGVSALCRRMGLPFCFNFIFGGPGETWETVDETFALADRLDPTAVLAALAMRILPGTDLQRRAIAEGVIGTADDLLFPTHYISPALRDGFEEGILERVSKRPNWIVPGLGVNYSPQLFELARRFDREGAHWRHVKRLRSSHRRPMTGR